MSVSPRSFSHSSPTLLRGSTCSSFAMESLLFLQHFDTSLVSCSTSTPASAYVAGDDGDDSQRLSASDLLREVEASVDANNELPPAANGALVAEQEQEESELFAEEVIQEKQKEQVQVTEGTQVSMPEDEEPVVPEEEAKAQAVYEPTTDELNKKIEEFIRKMKEEIRIEAQQQLIAV